MALSSEKAPVDILNAVDATNAIFMLTSQNFKHVTFRKHHHTSCIFFPPTFKISYALINVIKRPQPYITYFLFPSHDDNCPIIILFVFFEALETFNCE